MREVRISFRANPNEPRMVQLPAYCQTRFSLCGDDEEGLKIIEVLINGAAKKFRAIDDRTVSVSPPIPYEWDYVALVCLAANSGSEPPKKPRTTYPLPMLDYGLNRRQEHETRSI